ncbi:meiosis inhibitor protein 1 [Oncorhynchus tshawytscha]|uniref:meiosis inhibitor protein 1 n=1 Tax=Oncorhynchus tshawytscha TaxID=74940 RepID=UPI001C3C72BB|nr:meiosis inhibitor protein 1 [Oncorhynchus tshawytscha]
MAYSRSLRGCVCSPALQGLWPWQRQRPLESAPPVCRVNHQSSPVQYKQLEKLVEDIIARCTELPLPASSRCRVSLRGDEPSSQASRAGGFLLQALVCFHAACRLVEQCSSEPGLKENVFTAPSKQVQGQDPLESLCLCLCLPHCCDTVCIPTVTHPLVSSGWLWSTKLSSVQETETLNAVSCGFLQRLSVSLLSQPDPAASILPQGSCVVTLLCSVQEQGDSALPPCVLRSALYLLSVTQDKSPDLDWAPQNCISKALSSSPSFASLYTHHPPLLHFLFRYPELAEHFGPRVLELWLSHRAEATLQSDTNRHGVYQGGSPGRTCCRGAGEFPAGPAGL